MTRTVHLSRPIIVLSTLTIALFIIFQLFYSITYAATFSVTNSNDSGAGSLRQAISDTLTSPGPDRITFDAGLDGQTIFLTSGSLVISGEVDIDASNLPNDIIIDANNNFRVIEIHPNAIVTLNNLSIINGRTATGSGSCETLCGGGIFARSESHVSVINSKILNNFGNSAGGILNDGTMLISGTLVSGNRAAFDGGGIRTGFGKMTITHSSVVSNVTEMEFGGAGIYEEVGELVIQNSTIAYNRANGNGGGLRSTGSKSIIVSDSTFAHNSATSNGGGLFIDTFVGVSMTTSALTFINSTISKNTANVGAGGIYGFSRFTTTIAVTLTHSTVNENAGIGVALLSSSGGVATSLIQNSIIANSTGSNCVGISGNSFNLSTDMSCTGFHQGDPKLGALADNGGTTQTHALLANSAAFSLGDPSICQMHPNDQRGMERPTDRCDVGSTEFADLFLSNLPIIVR